MPCPAKTLSKTLALSPNLSNHSRLLRRCLFLKLLPPSLEKLGRQNTDIDELALRASVTVLTERGRWLDLKVPASYTGVTNSSSLFGFCGLPFKVWKTVWEWSAGTYRHVRTCSAQQSLESPGANRLVHFYLWNYRMSWAQPLMMPILFNVLYYGFTWRWTIVCSISCVFSLVFNVVLMLIVTVVTQGMVE